MRRGLKALAVVQTAGAERATLPVEQTAVTAMGSLRSGEQLFEGRHFDREVIILCVRWYLRFKLSLRDLVISRLAAEPQTAHARTGSSRCHSPLAQGILQELERLPCAGSAESVKSEARRVPQGPASSPAMPPAASGRADAPRSAHN